MKVKALLFGLLIAAATALTYTAITESNADQAIDKRRVPPPAPNT